MAPRLACNQASTSALASQSVLPVDGPLVVVLVVAATAAVGGSKCQQGVPSRSAPCAKGAEHLHAGQVAPLDGATEQLATWAVVDPPPSADVQAMPLGLAQHLEKQLEQQPQRLGVPPLAGEA